MATAAAQPKRWDRRHWRVDAIVVTALLSSIAFIVIVAYPALLPGRIERHAGHTLLTVLHIAGGTVMLVAGAIGLRIGLTRQAFRWHKTVGYSYIAGGSIAAVIAFERSFDTAHTPGLSTASLAAAWLAFTAMAWRAVRNRRVDQHRDWMIRSYVLAWTFVFCRFYTRAMPSALQGGETDMIWFTWVAPILLAEIAIQWRRGAAAPRA